MTIGLLLFAIFVYHAIYSFPLFVLSITVIGGLFSVFVGVSVGVTIDGDDCVLWYSCTLTLSCFFTSLYLF